MKKYSIKIPVKNFIVYLSFKSYFIIILLVFSFPINTWSQTYYIDPSSKNTIKDGSIKYPFNSWNEVIWRAGNYYLQKKSTVFCGEINVKASGTEMEPIVIGSYGEGDQPLLQGCVQFDNEWQEEDGVYSHSVPKNTGHYMFVDGKVQLEATSKKCLDGNWYRGGGPIIYYRPIDGHLINKKLSYGFFHTAIKAYDVNYLIIQDISITGYDSSENGYTAIHIKGKKLQSKGVKIKKCTIYHSGHKGITIDNAYAPEVSYCKLSNLGTCGIYYRNNTSNGTIHHNLVFSCGIYSRTIKGDVYGIAIGSGGNCVNNIIEYNEVYDIGNAEINNKLDCAIASWGKDVQTATIYRFNYIHNNAGGGINTGNHGGGSVVHDNLIVENGGNVSTNKNGGIYVSNASCDKGFVKVINNTVLYNIAPSKQGGIWTFDASSKIIIRHNIVANTVFGPEINLSTKIKKVECYSNCLVNEKSLYFGPLVIKDTNIKEKKYYYNDSYFYNNTIMKEKWNRDTIYKCKKINAGTDFEWLKKLGDKVQKYKEFILPEESSN